MRIQGIFITKSHGGNEPPGDKGGGDDLDGRLDSEEDEGTRRRVYAKQDGNNTLSAIVEYTDDADGDGKPLEGTT